MPGPLKTLRNTQSKIFIDTALAGRAVNIDLFHVSALDLWFGADETPRDTLTADFQALFTNVGFRGLQYPGGGINASYTTIPNNTTINGGAGSGYNCSVTNPANPVCTFGWTKDFFNEYIELCRLTGMRPSMSFNCQLDNAEFLAQNVWVLQRLIDVFGEDGITNVSYGMEDNIGNSVSYWESQIPVLSVPNITAAYIVRIADRLAAMKAAHPNWKFHIAGQDVLRTTENHILWGERLYKTYNGKSLNHDAVKLYIQSNDLFDGNAFVFSPTDFDYNLNQVNAVFDFNQKSKYSIPNIIKRFKEVHPNKKLGIWQHGWVNQDVTPVHHTVLANIYLAKFYSFISNYNYYNSDFIAYAAYQNMRNIITNANVQKAHYWGLWVVGPMFKNAPIYYPVHFDYPGLSGWAVKDTTDGKYRVCVINESATARTVTINAGNNTYSTVTRRTMWGSSLGSTTINTETIVGETPATIREFSTNTIEFTF